MKSFFPFILTAAIVLLSCSKSGNTVTHINCDGLITDTLGTNDSGRIYMPNAFTPNNDGQNEISKPIGINITSLVYTIYDANNTVVFTTNQLGQGWQTTVANNTFETYYYKIQATTTRGRHIGTCGELYKLSCFPSTIPKSSFFFESQLTQNGFTNISSEVLPNCP
jgi:gliding motility-associated-like protein